MMKLRLRILIVISLFCLLAFLLPVPAASRQGQSTVETRRKQLQALFDEQWEYDMRTHPEAATRQNDSRYNDRLGDLSPQFLRSDMEERRKFLARYEAIDASGFPTQDALSRTLKIRGLRQSIEGAQFKSWEMPVNQRGGPHLGLVELVSVTPFATVRDYENYVARLHQVPRVLDQSISNMRQGMQDKLMPPKYLLERVAGQAQSVADKADTTSPFAKPITSFPQAIPTADQERLRTAVLAAIRDEVIPAYRKFAAFLRDEYTPRGRTEPGVWSLPDGEARYRFEVRSMTTTDLTPEQIHEMGLKQITEIEAEMLALAKKLGYKDLASLNEHIKNERQFYATSGQQLLDLYTKYTRQMEPELPKLFGRLPKNKLDIVPMDTFRSKDAVPADYSAGAPDGSRAGRINVNEWDPEHRLLLNVEAIAYHEGIPGHHLQITIAQELQALPRFRRSGGYTAFTEGWALYAERLAKEVGFYQDPYSEYGRLENEMWRAIRLVVDTGVHQKHWSRQQMVDLFHRYTAMDEPNVQTEVDRYISWPGQALAYKLGQMEILKLRDQARQKLGDKFDQRSFNDAVIAQGPLPLDVLDEQVSAWIAEQAKGK